MRFVVHFGFLRLQRRLPAFGATFFVSLDILEVLPNEAGQDVPDLFALFLNLGDEINPKVSVATKAYYLFHVLQYDSHLYKYFAAPVFISQATVCVGVGIRMHLAAVSNASHSAVHPQLGTEGANSHAHG